MMERSDYLDNAKAILITIVVFGHLIESALSNPTTLALYKTIYAFHMPAFVLLAGYLSRSSTFGLKWASELLSIALVLVVAQGLYATRDAMSGNFLGLDYYLHHPRWVLWYLASLLAWKASLPLLRYGYVSVLLAVAISIVAGWVHYDPMLYSWQRTATFLPFFVAGYALQERRMFAPNTKAFRYAAIAIFASAFVFFMSQGSRVETSWLYGRQLYDPAFGPFEKLQLMALAALLIWAGAMLVPPMTTPFTRFGATTLSVFILHGVVVLSLRESFLRSAMGDSFIAALIAVGLVALLSHDALSRPFMWLWRAPKTIIRPRRVRAGDDAERPPS